MPEPFFKGNGIRKILLIAGGGLIILLCILGAVMLLSPSQKSSETVTVETQQTINLSIRNFYLDEELNFLTTPDSYPARDPRTRWNNEEIDSFFIPVDKILHEYFQKTNDNYTKEILSNIE